MAIDFVARVAAEGEKTEGAFWEGAGGVDQGWPGKP